MAGAGALLGVQALAINPEVSGVLGAWHGNSVVWVLLVPALYLFGFRALGRVTARAGRIALVLAIVLTVLETVGRSIYRYQSLEGLIGSTSQIFKTLLFMVGFCWIVWTVVAVLYGWLERPAPQASRWAVARLNRWAD